MVATTSKASSRRPTRYGPTRRIRGTSLRPAPRTRCRCDRRRISRQRVPQRRFLPPSRRHYSRPGARRVRHSAGIDRGRGAKGQLRGSQRVLFADQKRSVQCQRHVTHPRPAAWRLLRLRIRSRCRGRARRGRCAQSHVPPNVPVPGEDARVRLAMNGSVTDIDITI